MGPITSVSSQIIAPALAPVSGQTSGSGSFQDLLSASLQNVEAQGAQSEKAVQQFLSGETDDIHKVAIASQKAELSAQLFMQVRNKMISAYQEIMKMQM
jgi:flagellar hook-basal body complex protein FliE